MNFKKWVKSIQTAGYNGARTVHKDNGVNASEKLGVTVVGLPCGYAPDLFLILLNIAVMSPSLLVVVYDFAFYFCRAAGVSKILVETY